MTKKPASEISLGDVLSFPGRESHDDAAGLTVEIRVSKLRVLPDGHIDVWDARSKTWNWWRPDELVVFVRANNGFN